MAKGDTPPFRMIVEQGPRLAPTNGSDAERLSTYRVGSEVNVVFTRIGSRVMERKWWAILGLVVNRCNVPWTTKEQASEAVKLALGIVNLTKTVGGSWMQYPKSLTDLSDPELDDAVRDMMDLVTKLTGIDPETLRRETADVGREDEHESPDASSGDGSGDSIPVEDPAPTESASGGPAAPGETEPSSETPGADTLSPEDEKKWIVTLAATAVALIPQGKKAVIDATKNLYRDDLSEEVRKRARSIVKFAGQAAENEIDPDDALKMIAGIAKCDVKDLKT